MRSSGTHQKGDGKEMTARKTATRAMVLAGAALLLTGPAARADPGNETIATATALRFGPPFTIPYYSALSTRLSFSGDVDFYVFEVYTAGRVTFEIPGGSSVTLPNPRMDVFDGAGTLVAGPGSRTLTAQFSPGVYYPRVSSGSDSTGAYNFTVQGGGLGGATIGPVTIPEPGACALIASGLLPLAGTVLRRRGV
jgi:hypothetical protein